MNTAHIVRAIYCSSLLLLGSIHTARAQGTDGDITAVTATVQGFHAALTAGNLEAAAKFLAPDAVVLEGGEKETRKQYVEHHLLEDIKFAQAVPSTRGKTEVTLLGDVAWASSTSITRGTYRSKALNLLGAELVVLTRTSSGWLIRAIHWSSRSAK